MKLILALVVLFWGFCLLAFFIGLINPSLVFKDKENASRKRVFKKYGGLGILSFIIWVSILPSMEGLESTKDYSSNSYQENFLPPLDEKIIDQPQVEVKKEPTTKELVDAVVQQGEELRKNSNYQEPPRNKLEDEKIEFYIKEVHKQFPEFGTILFIEKLPNWAKGQRRAVTTLGMDSYTYYFEGVKLVSIYQDVNGRRVRIFQAE
jgi:hypothetical protein